MSRILIASTPLLGHVAPMLFVASSLKDHGHDILFLTGETFRDKVQQQGIAFTSLQGRANYDWRNLGSLFTEDEAGAEGLEGHIVHLKRLFGDAIPDQARSLETALEQHRADLIIVDVLYMGVLPLLLRHGHRPPVLSCGVIAPMWRDSGSSPFRGPDISTDGQKRNREDSQRFDAAVLPGTQYIDQVLAELGVAVDGGFCMFDTLYRVPDRLVQFCTAEFEYPLVELRQNFRFVGPILPAQTESEPVPDWINALDPVKPMIFVTQGTLANTDFDQLINPAIAALAEEPVTVVVTAGGGDPSQIARAPNTVAVPYVAYQSILPSASVFLTNGGYNGVQHALSYGVPVIAAGATEDKPYVAARVVWSGAGIDLKTGHPSPEQIRAAVRRVILQKEFRARAHVLSESIRHSDALASVNTLVLELVERTTHSGGGLTSAA